MVKNSGVATHQSMCSLSHQILNKLSVIIGSCDLLMEDLEESANPDAQTIRRLEMVRDVARELGEEVKERRCVLESEMRIALAGHAQQAVR